MQSDQEWKLGVSRAIVSALRARVQTAAGRRNDRLVERAGKQWIAWRSRNRKRVFAELRPLRGRIQVFILPRPRDLADARGLARRAPRTQGWGWFRSRFEISSMADVEPAAQLIVQSYVLGGRLRNAGRPARKVRSAQAL